MRKDNPDEIEFRFWRSGGHAKGRFAITVFAGLMALAIIATMFFWYRLTASGIAFYNHLGPQVMTEESHPPLEGGSEFAAANSGEGYVAASQNGT